jgi:hypothetical protein
MKSGNLPRVSASVPARVDQTGLVDWDSVDDTVAAASPLRSDVKIVTQRGQEDVLVTGFQTCCGEIVVMLDADGFTGGASFPVPL